MTDRTMTHIRVDRQTEGREKGQMDSKWETMDGQLSRQKITESWLDRQINEGIKEWTSVKTNREPLFFNRNYIKLNPQATLVRDPLPGRQQGCASPLP